MNRKKIYTIIYLMLALLLPALFLIDLMMGSVSLSLTECVDGLFGKGIQSNIEIMSGIRLPKAATAIFAGMALSVCGVLMQTLFRNPLAGPYVLGVNSGASLGVAVMMIGGSALGLQNFLGLFQSSIVLASVCGAVSILLIIMLVSARIRSNMALLLAGIMLGQIVSALQSLLEYFADAESLKGFVLWNMASIGNVDKGDLIVLMPIVMLFSFVVVFMFKNLDALLMGDEYAQSMGLNVRKIRFVIIIIAGVLTGIITAYCGPIAFIGIAVPHLGRMLMRTSLHKHIIPISMLIGPCILLLCDIICQLPSRGVILPLNVVAAMIGAPVVLYLLFRNFRFVN